MKEHSKLTDSQIQKIIDMANGGYTRIDVIRELDITISQLQWIGKKYNLKFKPCKKGKGLSPQEVKIIKEMKREGASHSMISRELGYSVTYITSRLEEFGMHEKRKNKKREGSVLEFKNLKDDDFRDLWSIHKGDFYAISKAAGCAQWKVRQLAREKQLIKQDKVHDIVEVRVCL